MGKIKKKKKKSSVASDAAWQGEQRAAREIHVAAAGSCRPLHARGHSAAAVAQWHTSSPRPACRLLRRPRAARAVGVGPRLVLAWGSTSSDDGAPPCCPPPGFRAKLSVAPHEPSRRRPRWPPRTPAGRDGAPPPCPPGSVAARRRQRRRCTAPWRNVAAAPASALHRHRPDRPSPASPASRYPPPLPVWPAHASVQCDMGDSDGGFLHATPSPGRVGETPPWQPSTAYAGLARLVSHQDSGGRAGIPPSHGGHGAFAPQQRGQGGLSLASPPLTHPPLGWGLGALL